MGDLKNTTIAKNSAIYNDGHWRCLAITLDTEGRRYQTFLKENKHLKAEIFCGIRGSKLSRQDAITQGLITRELAFSPLLTDGAVGCASSHKRIWDKAAKEDKGYFILEDDCYTHPSINEFITNNLNKLMEIDICFFGVNTDSILQSVCPTGLSTVKIFVERHPSKEWIMNSFSKTDEQAVELHRLIKAFGNCAYFISPKGGKELAEKIFPLIEVYPRPQT